jgi:hypothetical protein
MYLCKKGKRTMSIITESERAYLLESMKNLLSQYDYRYKDDALNKIITEWSEQKEGLITALKNHPQYIDGKFMVAFESNYERPVDTRVSNEFGHWLMARCSEREYLDKLPEELNAQRIDEGCRFLPSKLFSLFYKGMPDYAERTVSAEHAAAINEIVPNIKAREGEKTSRLINRLCTYLHYNEHPNYQREFAKYADSVSPITIKRHTVLSLNPLDYLTMSFGNSWASCHTIDKKNKRHMPNSYEGMYSSGTMSYMLDPSSMVFYTVDSSYKGDEYWSEPKITRQMFHYGEDKLVQGRLYPQDNDGAKNVYTPNRNIVQEIMSIAFGFPNLWTVKSGVEYAAKYINSRGTHYRDYNNFNNCTLSRITGRDNDNCFYVGAKPICIECGHTHTNAGNINCCHDGVTRCAHCGRYLNDEYDEIIWINGEPYCDDCVYYCDCCEEYHLEEPTYISSEDHYVCESCLDEYYVRCDICGEWVHVDDKTHIAGENIDICVSCRDEKYCMCADCETWYKADDMIADDDGVYRCEACAARRTEQEAE